MNDLARHAWKMMPSPPRPNTSCKVCASFAYVLLACLCLVLLRCDFLSPDGDPAVHIVIPQPGAELSASALEVRMDTAGAISADWPDPAMHGAIWDAGIWLAGRQNGDVRASIRALGASNLRAFDDDRQVGVFKLSADSVAGRNIAGWPVEYGAPSTGAGQPRLIGDEMLWSAYVPRGGELPEFSPQSLLESPLQDVLVSQTVIGFRSDDLKDVTLIHISVHNRGAVDVHDLHFGFYADIDLGISGCFNLGSNSVGFDSLNAISYTYPSQASGDMALNCEVPVIGYSLVSTAEFTAQYHVPLGKNWDLADFSEAAMRAPDDVLRRLQGLSSSGDPIIDPTTGQATNFAFAGDPVSERGWLGIRSDVRSLMSAGATTLAAGERTDVVVLVVAKKESRLSESLSSIQRQFRTVEDSGLLGVLNQH